MSSADLDTITSGIDLRIPMRPRPGIDNLAERLRTHVAALACAAGDSAWNDVVENK